jgi:hypothetical protein
MASEDEVRRLILEVIGEEKVRSLKKATDEERESLERLPKAHRDVGYAALEASRGIEDLQYGLGGVINNIPGLVLALGGTAGLTAAISLLAVGVNQLVKHWDDLAGLFEKRNPFPSAADDAKEFTKELDHVNEKIKEMEKHTSLSNEQLKTFNGLILVQTALERQLADAKQRRADMEKLTGPSKEEQERGRAFTEAIGGQGQEVREAMTGQMVKERIAELTRIGGPKESEAETRRVAGMQAEQILGFAMRGGVAEIEQVRGVVGERTQMGARMTELLPGRVAERADEARFIANQQKRAKLDEQIDANAEKARKAQVALNTAQMKAVEDANRVEEQAAKEKAQAARQEAQAAKRAASAKEQAARKNERDFIEDVRLRADQAIAGGAPAGLVGQQAAQMFERMARTNGRTTDLSQAQVRMMLHLQQVQERQNRQNEENERQIQRFWANAYRTGK